MAEDGKLDPVVGREKEIERVSTLEPSKFMRIVRFVVHRYNFSAALEESINL